MVPEKTPGAAGGAFPSLAACSYNLFHVPFFTVKYGSTPEGERHTNPDSPFLKQLPESMRTYREVCAYPPNQVFIGNLDPRQLPPRPWASGVAVEDEKNEEGVFGDIISEDLFYALMKYADVFDLISLEKSFSEKCPGLFALYPCMQNTNLKCFSKARDISEIREEIQEGALPLKIGESLVGSVKGAHPTDVNLSAHTILENLASKATGVYALRRCIYNSGKDPESIGYIIETSEEACGDINQRGGGNFAKAIGELAGCARATGSDTRSFCAGPAHGIVQAASLVKAGTFTTVAVVAGGTTAKLAMNGRKHIEKGLPVLEDCMGSFALIIEKDRESGNPVFRTDAVGMHKIGSGSSPQAVIKDLVVEPAESAGLSLSSIDYYAPELQNPEITENAGAGNVTAANLKMIAAMAVMRKEIEKSAIPEFTAAHGSAGWAPTQGHIPSGVPALGWISLWMKAGQITRALIIGKGSLFLGRMTNLFDGMSILVEKPDTGSEDKEKPLKQKAAEVEKKEISGKKKIGLTLPGFESSPEELKEGARLAMEADSDLEVLFFGNPESDPREAHREMDEALDSGNIHGAVTFHYSFPIGTATIGHTKIGLEEKDLFIAATTGTTAADRVKSLVLNALYGSLCARFYGIENPAVGLLNLEGAPKALSILKGLRKKGLPINLRGSVRGDDLLRGNDIHAGTVDVLVCDSLTGNAVTKLLATGGTGGRIEETGSGYGPGIGLFDKCVCIISRATGAQVVRNALLLAGRFAGTDIRKEVEKVLAQAGETAEKSTVPVPEKKIVNKEIEGVDVLEIDKAVSLLHEKGIYCEAGMGCTGPVVMIAEEDKGNAEEQLKRASFL